jgi:crotonobetainyl-CoA:carnitine CoA-transferase CaiB-like acyl-CoA transferase
VGLHGLPADPRFAGNPQRLQHRGELRGAIEAQLAGLPREALCRELMQLGVPVGAVLTVPEAFEQPHARHRGMRVEHDGYRGVGLPVKLCGTPGHAGSAPPGYAQHSDELLAEAGIDARERALLRASGALPERPSG